MVDHILKIKRPGVFDIRCLSWNTAQIDDDKKSSLHFHAYWDYSLLLKPNRLSSTIGGNREMGQLYTTSQVSHITRKTHFSNIS